MAALAVEASQVQLAVRPDVALDEALQLWRHVAPFEIDAAQYFLRDGVRNILGPVGTGRTSPRAAGHGAADDQIGNGGFRTARLRLVSANVAPVADSG